MSGYNKVIVLGRLGQDPALTATNGGMAVAKFSIATSKKKQDGTEVTSWHRCVAFDKRAEIVAQYVGKGQNLLIEGELSYGQYEKDGQKHYTTEIVVNSVVFVESKKQSQSQPPQVRPAVDPKQWQPPAETHEAQREDDIPF